MALACEPDLLIADEPTTALDVTTQAVILDLLKELQEDLGMAVLFITHDLGAVAELTDLVAVMYLGKVVERATVDHIFHRPMHPYTRALLRSVPRVGIGVGEPLDTIEGGVPHPFRRPSGCPFHPRCPEAMPDVCPSVVPTEVHLPDGGSTRCLLYGSAEERQSPGRELERSS